jgi:flagella basal body P-ring formation protein FlgA
MKLNPGESLWLASVAAAGMILSFSARAPAATATDREAIRRTAEQTVLSQPVPAGSRVTANVTPLDPRLQLAPCAAPLRGQLAGDGEMHDTVSVAVRCEQPVRWTVYVRVAVSAERPVLTARRLVPRGTTLTAADFELRPRMINGLGTRFPGSFQAIAGARLRLPINAGEVLNNDMLEQLPLIKRGQQVTLLARSAAMEIRVAAVAMTDGHAEERIHVQNQSSRQIVEAVVRSSELVEVPL